MGKHATDENLPDEVIATICHAADVRTVFADAGWRAWFPPTDLDRASVVAALAGDGCPWVGSRARWPWWRNEAQLVARLLGVDVGS